jgi:hypothetical protein
MTLVEFFSLIEMQIPSNNLTVELPSRRRNAFVTYAKCKNCRHCIKVNRPLIDIESHEYSVCPVCGALQQGDIQNVADLTIQLETRSSFDRNTSSELLSFELQELGFSSLDIIPVKDVKDKYYYFELTKDAV